MCLYAMVAYKPHLACFDCRKTFRRRLLKDVSENSSAVSVAAKCPECGQPLADMGLDFKSPPKKDVKAWRHAAELYAVGITYHSCGCSGPGYIPRDNAALLRYLEEIKDEYVAHLRAWLNHTVPKTKKESALRKQKNDYLYPPFDLLDGRKRVPKEEVIAYWTHRIKRVENNILTVKGQNVASV